MPFVMLITALWYIFRNVKVLFVYLWLSFFSYPEWISSYLSSWAKEGSVMISKAAVPQMKTKKVKICNDIPEIGVCELSSRTIASDRTNETNTICDECCTVVYPDCWILARVNGHGYTLSRREIGRSTTDLYALTIWQCQCHCRLLVVSNEMRQ